MNAPARSARRRFVDEVCRTEEEIDLARAALLIAGERYPQLPVETYLGRLDHLAEEVVDRLEGETAPALVVRTLIHTLFEVEGFRGNSEAYHDPRNSFLNDVLDRRLGIPLTLGIVLLEVGWRLGLAVEGVNFPHHFLVRFRGEAVSFLIDPFEGGRIYFEDQAQEVLDRVYGGMIRVRPGFLARASRREMLARLLTNLKGIYLNAHDDARALSVVERLLVVRPDATMERRTLGVLLARVGRRDEGVRHLTEYLDALPPGAREARRIEALIARLQSGGNVDDPEVQVDEGEVDG
ncbi:MAG: transglutaminase-like domain-containing protein [Longimicrobiales bacterium]|nr:transglutaminase-like domain-containing protein [Longimicrobiales bacterium]